MGRRAETKVGRISILPVLTRYVVVQDRSAAALGAVGRPSEILIISDMISVGKGLKITRGIPHSGSPNSVLRSIILVTAALFFYFLFVSLARQPHWSLRTA